MFSYLISGFEKSMQATLNAMYAKSNMIDEENYRREMEQMKKEIADDIMSRISATVDVSEIIDEIEEISELRKTFYKTMLQQRYEKILMYSYRML